MQKHAAKPGEISHGVFYGSFHCQMLSNNQSGKMVVMVFDGIERLYSVNVL